MPILEWLDKNEAINAVSRVPYRILKVNKELSYGKKNENMIIKGDNLEALRALLPYYKGQVKCIYIDPPYNTGNAFEHYDDNLEHSMWLSLIYPRLELLRDLLSEDGSIWITLDYKEVHYAKVIADEIFGRKNFIVSIAWRSSDNSNNDAKQFSLDHNDILVYSKNEGWLSNKVQRNDEQTKHYKNPDNDPRGPWFDGNPLGSPSPRPNLTFDIVAPNGNIIKPPLNGWRWSKETLIEKIQTGEIRYNKDFTAIKRRTYLYEQPGVPPSSLWINLEQTGHNRQAKYEQKYLFPEFNKNEWFGTPKPEKLVSYILSIATNEGDLVLDSFLGSGTTCAVAQKMGRKYIGIEMGEHAITHCVPRMKAVIDGEQGGISKVVNWQGGGGYTFYDLGETVFNENGNINKGVDFKTLASHIWFSETKTPLLDFEKSPLLGIYNGIAYYLLYNGILGDKKPDGGNVLTQKIFDTLPKFNGKKVIYGEVTRMNEDKRKLNNITFKQTPYDIKVR